MDESEQVREINKLNLVKRLINFVKYFWSIRFIRFLFVGGINTLFGYGVYTGLILLHLHYALASLISTIAGIFFNFFTVGNFVFRNKDSKLVFRFFAVYGITYLINLGFLKVFNNMHMNMVLAGAILLLPISLISYTLNRLLVFRNKPDQLKTE
jgi:putative flippase GtrA